MRTTLLQSLPDNDVDYVTGWSAIKRYVSQKVRHLVKAPTAVLAPVRAGEVVED
jgi:hypothetical protein